MLDIGELKKGTKCMIDGDPYLVTDYEFAKPGKGQAIYRVRMRNLITGFSIDRSYRSGERFPEADTSSQPMEYSYHDGSTYCFVDPSTFENYFADEKVVGDKLHYLLPNTPVDVLLFGERIIDITLPPSVVLKIVKSDPGARGDTATNVTKGATLETGVEVQVPLFVGEGEYIRVDTRTGQYIERVKK